MVVLVLFLLAGGFAVLLGALVVTAVLAVVLVPVLALLRWAGRALVAWSMREPPPTAGGPQVVPLD